MDGGGSTEQETCFIHPRHSPGWAYIYNWLDCKPVGERQRIKHRADNSLKLCWKKPARGDCVCRTDVIVDEGNGGIPAIRFDFFDQPPDPIRIGVFRGDSCDTYAQLEIGSSGLRIVYDSEAAPDESIDIVDLYLSAQPPDPCINGAVVSPG